MSEDDQIEREADDAAEAGDRSEEPAPDDSEANGQRGDRRATAPGHVMPRGPVREEDRPIRDKVAEEPGQDPPEPGELPPEAPTTSSAP